MPVPSASPRRGRERGPRRPASEPGCSPNRPTDLMPATSKRCASERGWSRSAAGLGEPVAARGSISFAVPFLRRNGNIALGVPHGGDAPIRHATRRRGHRDCHHASSAGSASLSRPRPLSQSLASRPVAVAGRHWRASAGGSAARRKRRCRRMSWGHGLGPAGPPHSSDRRSVDARPAWADRR